jgi:hypothetical protein
MRRRLQRPERQQRQQPVPKQPVQQRQQPVPKQPVQQRQQPVPKQPVQQQELQQQEPEQELLLLFCRKQPEQQPTGKRSTVFFS